MMVLSNCRAQSADVARPRLSYRHSQYNAVSPYDRALGLHLPLTSRHPIRIRARASGCRPVGPISGWHVRGLPYPWRRDRHHDLGLLSRRSCFSGKSRIVTSTIEKDVTPAILVLSRESWPSGGDDDDPPPERRDWAKRSGVRIGRTQEKPLSELLVRKTASGYTDCGRDSVRAVRRIDFRWSVSHEQDGIQRIIDGEIPAKIVYEDEGLPRSRTSIRTRRACGGHSQERGRLGSRGRGRRGDGGPSFTAIARLRPNGA